MAASWRRNSAEPPAGLNKKGMAPGAIPFGYFPSAIRQARTASSSVSAAMRNRPLWQKRSPAMPVMPASASGVCPPRRREKAAWPPPFPHRPVPPGRCSRLAARDKPQSGPGKG